MSEHSISTLSKQNSLSLSLSSSSSRHRRRNTSCTQLSSDDFTDLESIEHHISTTPEKEEEQSINNKNKKLTSKKSWFSYLSPARIHKNNKHIYNGNTTADTTKHSPLSKSTSGFFSTKSSKLKRSLSVPKVIEASTKGLADLDNIQFGEHVIDTITNEYSIEGEQLTRDSNGNLRDQYGFMVESNKVLLNSDNDSSYSDSNNATIEDIAASSTIKDTSKQQQQQPIYNNNHHINDTSTIDSPITPTSTEFLPKKEKLLHQTARKRISEKRKKSEKQKILWNNFLKSLNDNIILSLSSNELQRWRRNISQQGPIMDSGMNSSTIICNNPTTTTTTTPLKLHFDDIDSSNDGSISGTTTHISSSIKSTPKSSNRITGIAKRMTKAVKVNRMTKAVKTLNNNAKAYVPIPEKMKKMNRPKAEQLTFLIRRYGIPPKLRGNIWFAVSGACEKSINALPNESYNHILSSLNSPIAAVDIERDLHRTFPTNYHFEDAEGIASLRNVLLAYSIRNKKVGYCQSMNFLVATLLLHMEEEQAFWVLASIVEDLVPGHYTRDMIGMHVDQRVFVSLVEQRLPRIYIHLTNLGLPLGPIAYQWILCLFVNALPLETTLRIWDIFLHEGVKALFRVALGLLKILRKDILETTTFQAAYCLLSQGGCSKNISKFNSHKLMKLIYDPIWFGTFSITEISKLRTLYLPEVMSEINKYTCKWVDSVDPDICNNVNQVDTTVKNDEEEESIGSFSTIVEVIDGNIQTTFNRTSSIGSKNSLSSYHSSNSLTFTNNNNKQRPSITTNRRFSSNITAARRLSTSQRFKYSYHNHRIRSRSPTVRSNHSKIRRRASTSVVHHNNIHKILQEDNDNRRLSGSSVSQPKLSYKQEYVLNADELLTTQANNNNINGNDSVQSTEELDATIMEEEIEDDEDNNNNNNSNNNDNEVKEIDALPTKYANRYNNFRFVLSATQDYTDQEAEEIDKISEDDILQ